MPIQPTSFENIKVGYISETDGYVHEKSVVDANNYEELYPGTQYIFINGDGKVVYLDIAGVNALTPRDLLRSDPCDTTEKPCGPPSLKFFGGHGIGAAGNPIVDVNGQLIAVDLINGGGGYTSPPQVQVIDPCNIGSGAVLQTQIKDGVVVKVIVGDTGTGYLPPPPQPTSGSQYPALLTLTEIKVLNPGFNYNCGVDKLTVTPNNGTVLSYECGAFGKILRVKVEKGGNFTELPRITMPSDQGLNARFVPVFDIIRDPFVPEVAPPSDVVQVFDLVGANITGYVDGKSYYGNVYFSDGIKYAGTSATGGTKIRVYDTRPASIKGNN